MWLPSLDSNQGYVVQSHACYRCTTRQMGSFQCIAARRGGSRSGTLATHSRTRRGERSTTTSASPAMLGNRPADAPLVGAPVCDAPEQDRVAAQEPLAKRLAVRAPHQLPRERPMQRAPEQPPEHQGERQPQPEHRVCSGHHKVADDTGVVARAYPPAGPSVQPALNVGNRNCSRGFSCHPGLQCTTSRSMCGTPSRRATSSPSLVLPDPVGP